MALRKEVAASQNVDDDKNPILTVNDEADENGPTYNETQAIKDLKAQLSDPSFHELDVDHKNFLRTELKTLIQEQMRKAREERKAQRVAAMEAERKLRQLKREEEAEERMEESELESMVKFSEGFNFMGLFGPHEIYEEDYVMKLVAVLVTILYLMTRNRIGSKKKGKSY